MDKEKISLCVDRALWQQYQDYCKSQGFSFSGRVELLIRKELEMSKRKEKKQAEIIMILADMINERNMEQETGQKPVPQQVPKAPMSPEQINKLNITDLKSLTERYLERKRQKIAGAGQQG